MAHFIAVEDGHYINLDYVVEIKRFDPNYRNNWSRYRFRFAEGDPIVTEMNDSQLDWRYRAGFSTLLREVIPANASVPMYVYELCHNPDNPDGNIDVKKQFVIGWTLNPPFRVRPDHSCRRN